MWCYTTRKKRKLLLGLILGTQVRPGRQFTRLCWGTEKIHHIVSFAFSIFFVCLSTCSLPGRGFLGTQNQNTTQNYIFHKSDIFSRIQKIIIKTFSWSGLPAVETVCRPNLVLPRKIHGAALAALVDWMYTGKLTVHRKALGHLPLVAYYLKVSAKKNLWRDFECPEFYPLRKNPPL